MSQVLTTVHIHTPIGAATTHRPDGGNGGAIILSSEDTWSSATFWMGDDSLAVKLAAVINKTIGDHKATVAKAHGEIAR